MSSKTPGRDMVEKWSLEMLDPYKTFTEALKDNLFHWPLFPFHLTQSLNHEEPPSPP